MTNLNYILPSEVLNYNGQLLTEEEKVEATRLLLGSDVIDRVSSPTGLLANVLYIVGTSASGLWLGQDNALATKLNGRWLFFPPGFRSRSFYIVTQNTLIRWNGIAWVPTLTVEQGGNFPVFTSKGQLITYNGESPSLLSLGLAGQILSAAPNSSQGLDWINLNLEHTLESHEDIDDFNPAITGRYVLVKNRTTNQWEPQEIIEIDTTDDLPEGEDHLYYSNLRVDNRIGQLNLDRFSDVDYDEIQPDQILKRNSEGKWVNVNLDLEHTLESHEDVDDLNPAITGRYALIKNRTTNQWEPQEIIELDTTDDLLEGDDNLYYSDFRVDSRISTRWNILANRSYVIVNGNYTVGSNDQNKLIVCNSSSSLVINCSSSLLNGFEFKVFNLGSGTVTLSGTQGSPNVSGVTSLSNNQGCSMFLVVSSDPVINRWLSF